MNRAMATSATGVRRRERAVIQSHRPNEDLLLLFATIRATSDENGEKAKPNSHP